MAPVAANWLMSPEDQKVAPFKAFDDAWFVGVCWVSAWLLPTPQGHFLIDTLHEPHAAVLLDNISRRHGFDPKRHPLRAHHACAISTTPAAPRACTAPCPTPAS